MSSQRGAGVLGWYAAGMSELEITREKLLAVLGELEEERQRRRALQDSLRRALARLDGILSLLG